MSSIPSKAVATHVLIRTWVEVPPKWDVVPVGDIKGKLKPGETCDVNYDYIKNPYATILMLGNEDSLKKELHKIEIDEKNQEDDEEEEEKEPKESSSKRTKRQCEVAFNKIQLTERVLKLEVKIAQLQTEIEKLKGQETQSVTPEVSLSDPREVVSSSGMVGSTSAKIQSSPELFPQTQESAKQDEKPIDYRDEKPIDEKTIEQVSIGPNTKVPSSQYNLIDWKKGRLAVRELCVSVFGRQVLKTHSLTGRSPRHAKKDLKTVKPRLDPDKVADIIGYVRRKTDMTEAEIKRAITSKCADVGNTTRTTPIEQQAVMNNV